MITDRANAICLLEILREYSDAQHILTMKDLISKLNAIYGLKPDRRTVYSAVALLIDLGYDISIYEDNGTGYYLRSRDLEQPEVLLLMDAVYAFPFIPVRQSEELIQKLQKQLSSHQRKLYRHLTIVRQDRKTDNRQVFLNLELLDEAIAEKKQVSFYYLTYGLDKKLHPRRNSVYTVNPYGLAYMNEHYYLACNRSSYPETSLYRLDLIRDIKKLDSPWDKKPAHKNEVQDAVYAFTGKPENVTLHCNRGVLGDVLDKFGTAIRVYERDEETVTVNFNAPPRGIKFWALQYLPYVEVVTPQWLRDEIIESIQRNRYIQPKIKSEKEG